MNDMNDKEKPRTDEYAFGIKQHIFTIFNMKTPRTDEEKIFDIGNLCKYNLDPSLVESTGHYTNSEIMRLIKMVVDCPSKESN